MTPARKTASWLCAIAAVAAGAGAVIARRAHDSAAAAAAQRNQAETAGVLEATQTALEGLERGLEIELKNAAAIPQLKAVLAEGVDPVTILDLFDSEDWWAPFRSRGAALITARRTLAARTEKGDKRMPLPDVPMLQRARTAGVASGVLVGDNALIVAVVPVGSARQGDSIYLVMAMPLAAQDLQRATGTPVMLSDGTRPVSAAGSASQQSALSRLVGRENEGRAGDPESTWLALAISIGPKLWLWVLHPVQAGASPSGAVSVLFGILAIVLVVAAFLLRRARGARSIS
jgi:hypothetical protein